MIERERSKAGNHGKRSCKALVDSYRSEIDEVIWALMYKMTSRLFLDLMIEGDAGGVSRTRVHIDIFFRILVSTSIAYAEL